MRRPGGSHAGCAGAALGGAAPAATAASTARSARPGPTMRSPGRRSCSAGSAAASLPRPAGRVTAVPAGAAQGPPTAAIPTAGAGAWPAQKSAPRRLRSREPSRPPAGPRTEAALGRDGRAPAGVAHGAAGAILPDRMRDVRSQLCTARHRRAQRLLWAVQCQGLQEDRRGDAVKCGAYGKRFSTTHPSVRHCSESAGPRRRGASASRASAGARQAHGGATLRRRARGRGRGPKGQGGKAAQAAARVALDAGAPHASAAPLRRVCYTDKGAVKTSMLYGQGRR